METKITTIQVNKTTRDRLLKNGCKGETYDDVIKRSLDISEKESD